MNPWLVEALEQSGLWTPEMAEALKASDGQLKGLPMVPHAIKEKYPDVFELDQTWLVRAAGIRGKWLDQSQSLNLFMAQPQGKALHQLYVEAWQWGLKTTYYLRTLGASQVEKATVSTAQYGKTHQRQNKLPLNACALDDPECEACQ